MWKEHLTTIWTVLSCINYILAFYVTQKIVRTRREPRGTLAWVLAILLLPFLGLALYALVGELSLQRKVKRRRRRRMVLEKALAAHTHALEETHDVRMEGDLGSREKALISLARRVSGAVVTRNNDAVLYNDAEQAFLALALGIESARQFVHMEYYIFAEDDTGRAMRDLLIRKAKEGVEVRLLLDAIGSWRLSRKFIREMTDAGVKFAFFLPWGLTERRLQVNFRNHRKLVVIDGKLAFTGSKNIADEYLGRKKKFGPWRDTYLRLRGPCVTQLQEIFIEDWHFASQEALFDDKYFPRPSVEGKQWVQIVPSGPDRGRNVLHHLLHAAVADAQEKVSFLTPYFVPDSDMMMVLTTAAYRGVKVQLLIPSRTDQRLILWAGRSFYDQLIEAGVEVYEYDKAMLHSKVAVVDTRWCMVGSANMDVRSFRLNFELTTLLYDGTLAAQLQEEFDVYLKDATRISNGYTRNRPYSESLTAGLARLATPML